jgi:hypothetical protein
MKLNHQLDWLITPAILFFFGAGLAYGQMPPPGKYFGPTNTPLDSWSFRDSTGWTSDLGYSPISFTNLNYSYRGDGASLVVDTNLPAWLQYNVYESDGTTNLTVDCGSITFWYAPASWSSANAGGTGPGEFGRLFEVGNYTSDSSYGLWNICVDDGGNNIFFSAQTNDLSGTLTTYISAPISWTTNDFHFIALTYSPSNTALYFDGVQITNGPGVTVYPGPDVLANGFIIGSDATGIYQANGLFSSVATYGYPLSSNDIVTIFNWNYNWYEINPFNISMFSIVSAPSNPSGATNYYNAITGQGGLQLAGSVSAITSSNVWIANVTANGTAISFTIQGGSNGVPYDVFANSILDFSSDTNKAWAWMGQGYHGNTYTLTNMPSTACFLILGTPQDTDGDGLTDAFERLVSKTNPNVADTDSDGLLDSWEVLLGLNALQNDNAQPGTRANYSYTGADWLNGVSGIRSGSITNDPEGNVITVSQ